ncbi:hypothetical protein [Aquimarina sp. 2201CG14-23]|uniref:hypothetical protein n=1 Tax=Aquimarina mycalae TaxID=3040073 RepID=UPI0024782E68|nr:hypothetical protein [Aquimarina sp. 2201CG14-23]MDH7447463.1 hypothetical protein [Aquimarina sp. 2201CG14-23]
MIITRKVTNGVVVATIVLLILFLYRLSPYKLEFLGHYDKIWAHRVNSTEKLHSALKHYKGVELDLIYDAEKDFFDINHPPAKTINLKFEDYIATLEKSQYPLLWLDIKNLKKDNETSVLNKLLEIFNKRKYPLQNVLIETRYSDALPIFTQSGFKTSYYLPYGLRNRNEEKLQATIQKIKKIINEQPEIGISTNHKDYHIIKEHFPNRTKYIWILVPIINIDFLTTREILNDDHVDVVLVNYVSLRGNR